MVMIEEPTPATVRAAEKLGMDPVELTRILDVWMESAGEVAREKRYQRELEQKPKAITPEFKEFMETLGSDNCGG